MTLRKDLIDLRGADLADVLAALYNAAKPVGLGFLLADTKPMDRQMALVELARAERGTLGRASAAGHGYHGAYFDYLHGRVMKVHVSHKIPMRTDLYDRDNGPGACATALGRIPGWVWWNGDWKPFR